MAVIDYSKYQILLFPDSKKVQGLQTGDIVRRQYFDGTNTIYSLMCVLERKQNPETGLYEERPYFIGALLEGDVPKQNELLDFARITNLFNVDRSGALYLTASDDQAPFMDVIDGIGRNESLSWPENVASEDFEDAKSQYIVDGRGPLHATYTQYSQGNNRILTVTRLKGKSESFEGLRQDFYQFIKRPNEVLVSYKIRASKTMQVQTTLGYQSDLRIDAEWTEDLTTEWQYVFRVATVEYSGRHLRTFKINMEDLAVGDEIQIADFNIILLSSVSNFAAASATRIGKLDGIIDPVFGHLTGYGAYLQKLYAANAAHISGTLTAGDENGFGATFYAGKIHRNCFVNSLDVNFQDSVSIADKDIINPTGIGHVYSINAPQKLFAQTNEWLKEHLGKRYCFSFWAYAKCPCTIGIRQNDKVVGSIHIASDQTHEWRRVHAYFDLLLGDEDDADLILSVVPSFENSEFDSIPGGVSNIDERLIYFVAPQLESGEDVTQYQPTDSELNYTDDYGAWMARGGIGGTIQNPLLQLNMKDIDENGVEHEGTIGTRTKSFALRTDGSGYLANHNIKWDSDGKVTFGKDVTLSWENLSGDAQDNMANRYMRIVGEDTFTIIGQEDSTVGKTFSPASIKLSLEEVGFKSTSSQRQWYYRYGGEFKPIDNANGSTLEVSPDSPWWNGESFVTFQCVIVLNASRTYIDTFTVKKQYVQGYTVLVTSSKGLAFQNGKCQTILTAQVYYQGKLVDREYALANFVFNWYRYKANDLQNPIPFIDYDTPDEPDTITLNYELDGSDIFVCELATADYFDYTFPILF